MLEAIIFSAIALLALIFLVRHFRRKGSSCSSCTQHKCPQRDNKK